MAIISLTVQLWIGVLGYIGIVQHKEHSPEVLSIPPGTPCIYIKKNLSSCYNEYTSCRQQLRESSIELRNLEAQLRAAYISKELAAQMAEKEAARMKEKVRKLNTSCS